MDELELVRTVGHEQAATPAARNRARQALQGAIEGRKRTTSRWSPRNGLAKVATVAGLSTAAIMTQPHTPLGLPGHRALGWLSLLLIVRLVGGTGWASAVGLASALGTMAIHRSPNGSFWGVAQYVLAGVGIDAFLAAFPSIGRNPFKLAGLGALLLVLVGWITPVSNAFVGGVPLHGIWVSISAIGAAGWIRLVKFDLLFGAGAGLIAYGLAWVLNQSWRDIASRVGLQAG